MRRRTYSLSQVFLLISLSAVLCGWQLDRYRLQRELGIHRLLDGSYKERVEIVRARDWQKTERDIEVLLFLLTDPYHKVVSEAELQLEKLYRGSHHLPYGNYLTRIEKINAWTSCYLNDKVDNPLVMQKDVGNSTDHANTDFDPDPWRDGTLFEEMELGDWRVSGRN